MASDNGISSEENGPSQPILIQSVRASHGDKKHGMQDAVFQFTWHILIHVGQACVDCTEFEVRPESAFHHSDIFSIKLPNVCESLRR